MALPIASTFQSPSIFVLTDRKLPTIFRDVISQIFPGKGCTVIQISILEQQGKEKEAVQLLAGKSVLIFEAAEFRPEKLLLLKRLTTQCSRIGIWRFRDNSSTTIFTQKNEARRTWKNITDQNKTAYYILRNSTQLLNQRAAEIRDTYDLEIQIPPNDNSAEQPEPTPFAFKPLVASATPFFAAASTLIADMNKAFESRSEATTALLNGDKFGPPIPPISFPISKAASNNSESLSRPNPITVSLPTSTPAPGSEKPPKEDAKPAPAPTTLVPASNGTGVPNQQAPVPIKKASSWKWVAIATFCLTAVVALLAKDRIFHAFKGIKFS